MGESVCTVRRGLFRVTKRAWGDLHYQRYCSDRLSFKHTLYIKSKLGWRKPCIHITSKKEKKTCKYEQRNGGIPPFFLMY